MTPRLWLCVVLVLGAPVGVMAQAPDLSHLDIVERSVPDGPVALVDGAAVTKGDFLFLYRSQLTSIAMAKRGVVIDDDVRIMTGIQCFRELLQREVLHQESQRRGMRVTDEALEQAYRKKLGSLQERLNKPGDLPATEEDVLRISGQTREEARRTLRKSMLVEVLQDALAAEQSASVTEAGIVAFYKENPEFFQRPQALHVRQIYIQPKPNVRDADEEAWNSARKKMDKVLARIRVGESFEGVACDVSESPDREAGGDLGMLAIEQLPPFFRDIGVKLAPGEMSEVFKSEHGLHLIQVVERNDGGGISLEEAHDDIGDLLREQDQHETVARFCEPIMADVSRVKVFLQFERVLANVETAANNELTK